LILKRSYLRTCTVVLSLLAVSLGLSACGKNFYFAGRPFPPSGVINRVMLTIDNPSPITTGALQFVDALYDIRHSYNNKVAVFSISGYSGKLPTTIENLPAEEIGAVYNSGDGTLALVNYGTEAVSTTVPSPGGLLSSVFLSHDRRYVIGADQAQNVLSVVDQTEGRTFDLNLPGVFRVSVNPGGTLALAFIQNSDLVYSISHLTAVQQQAAANNPNYLGAQDCEPRNLPEYCVYPVAAGPANGAALGFDRPQKAVFSPDGSAAYVLDCGPECGGTTAGVTVIPITTAALNPGVNGLAGLALAAGSRLAIPGGATNAIFNGDTMYIAGQQELPDGLFTGELSIVDISTLSLTGTYGISDGTHNKMLFADDNTLWIGSITCESGERYKQVQAGGGSTQYGCMTMFNTATNTVTTIESYKGDGTGIAAVTGLHKVYTAEGGQVYIYSTTDGAALDNSNVTVAATVIDVAYMDAPTDDDNTTY
jgi:hypothetical protein